MSLQEIIEKTPCPDVQFSYAIWDLFNIMTVTRIFLTYAQQVRPVPFQWVRLPGAVYAP